MGQALKFLLLFLCGGSAAEGRPLKVVTHVHSLYSHGGMQTLEAVVRRASEKGIDAVLLTDTALASWEYGLWPLRSILRRRVRQDSILEAGPERYLAEIARLRRAYPSVVIVPGCEAAAYYRWEGRPWSSLVLRDWHRHLLLLGLEEAEDYRGLPLLGNPRAFSMRWTSFWPFCLLLFAWAARELGLRRCAGWLMGVGVVLGADALLGSRGPNWDQYQAATPWGPYQLLAEYAQQRGALAFWAHPEAAGLERPKVVERRVSVATEPYPEAVRLVPEADGFGAIMEGMKKVAQPGGAWDEALLEYVGGSRSRPAWAIAELDYRAPGWLTTDMDATYMVVEAGERTPQAVLSALRAGRFYSVRPERAGPMELAEWSLSEGGRRAGSGETLKGARQPRVAIRISLRPGQGVAAEVRVVRNGKVILQERRELPAGIDFVDSSNDSEYSFYRVMAKDDERGLLVSNPIFLRNGALQPTRNGARRPAAQ